MTKYIKTKDGKFAGSISDGKNSTPTSAPPMPPAQRIRNKPEYPSPAPSVDEQYRAFQKHYFGADGNYGDADRLTVVDTSQWTEEDWDTIEESADFERSWIAQKISEKYSK